jgi:hypothetical protein
MLGMAESKTPSRWPAYARVPPFLPVPLRARADGWSIERQARFIGFLAETGSVAAAARRVGMSRESAHRLRRRPGAASFTHAWDIVIACHEGLPRDDAQFPRRKITPDELFERAFDGAIHIRMRRRRFVRAQRKPSSSALFRLYVRVRSQAARDGRERW